MVYMEPNQPEVKIGHSNGAVKSTDNGFTEAPVKASGNKVPDGERPVTIAWAKAFLDLLNPKNDSHTFFSITDSREVDKRNFAQWHGPAQKSWKRLKEYNADGRGAFVTIGRPDGSGLRKGKHVEAPRAVFIEIDAKDAGIPKDLPLEPSWVNESSPGKYHVYFIVDGLTWEQYAGVMRHMVQVYDSDSSAMLRSQVMRIPGFWHLKGDVPFQTRPIFSRCSLARYSVDQIIAAFPPITTAVKAREKKAAMRAGKRAPRGKAVRDGSTRKAREDWCGEGVDDSRVVQAMQAIDKLCCNGPVVVHDTSRAGNEPVTVDLADREFWLLLGICLFQAYGGTQRGFDLWVAISRGDVVLGLTGCPAKFDMADQERAWDSFSGPSQVQAVAPHWRTVRTIFWLARMAGCKLPGRPQKAPAAAPTYERHESMAPVAKAAAQAVQAGVDNICDLARSKMSGHGLAARLLRNMADDVDRQTGMGKLPNLQAVAEIESVTYGAVQKTLRKLMQQGFVVKSDGKRRGADNVKGVSYAISLPDDAWPELETSVNDTAELADFDDGTKAALLSPDGQCLETWARVDVLSPVLVRKNRTAAMKTRKNKDGEKRQLAFAARKSIAVELQYWLRAGMSRANIAAELLACASFLHYEASMARSWGDDNVDLEALTPSQYTSCQLRAMSRHSQKLGLATPGVAARTKFKEMALRRAAKAQKAREAQAVNASGSC